jgi:ABC-2 type transport system permease protein
MTLGTLVGRSLARTRGLLLGIIALLMAFQVLVVVVASEQHEAQSFDFLMRLAPAFIQRQMGPTMSLLLSFQGLVTFGYFHPVVVLTIALVAALVASELAGDVEAGLVDLLLSRPVERSWLVTRSLVMLAIVPALLVASMMAATWGALAAFAPSTAVWPTVTTMAACGIRLVAVAWCIGAAGLALAAFARRRAGGFAPAAVAAVSLYLLDLLAGAWRPIQPAGLVSPFHYYQGAAVLAGSATTARDLGILLSMTIPLVMLAYWQFGRRDV